MWFIRMFEIIHFIIHCFIQPQDIFNDMGSNWYLRCICVHAYVCMTCSPEDLQTSSRRFALSSLSQDSSQGPQSLQSPADQIYGCCELISIRGFITEFWVGKVGGGI